MSVPPTLSPQLAPELTLTLAPASPAQPAQSRAVARTRVLHLINGEHYSGAERVQDLLALCLPAEGFEVGFACLKPDRFPPLRQSQHAALMAAPMRHKFDLSILGKLTRMTRGGGYSLVHAHTPRTALIGRVVAAWAGVPFVYHVHSPTARDSTRAWSNRFNALVERQALRSAGHLIAVSESLGRWMRELLPNVPLTVVPNGVPAAKTLLDRQPPQGDWTLGVVALFRPRKGIEVLLAALAELKQARCPVRLRAIGGFETPQYEAEVKALAKQLEVADRVEWAGFTSDVPAELARLDALVLPSLFGEGLPMVVLEAMAAGVPVIATSVEGVPEALRDRQDGLLVAPGDTHALAAGIRELVEGQVDWSRLRASALARHGEKFSDRAMAAGVAQVYRQVLSEASLSPEIMPQTAPLTQWC